MILFPHCGSLLGMFRTSQGSDVGSIPIARSNKPCIPPFGKASLFRAGRFQITPRLWGSGVTGTGLTRGQAKRVYLFSGLVVCGECGGSITLVGGRAKTSRSEYGCSLHAQRGNSVCKNDLRIQRQQMEDRLLAGLQDRVLRQEFIDYVICGLQEELRQRHGAFESGLKALRDERQRIEAELRRLVESLAVGNGSPTVMAAMAERDARRREIMNQVIQPGPGLLQEKLEELRTFAVSRLTRLRELLTNPGAIHEARVLLAEQIGKFTLERVEENGKVSFKANGNIDFFGEEAFTRVGGAGGPAWTERLPVRFEWLAAA